MNKDHGTLRCKKQKEMVSLNGSCEQFKDYADSAGDLMPDWYMKDGEYANE